VITVRLHSPQSNGHEPDHLLDFGPTRQRRSAGCQLLRIWYHPGMLIALASAIRELIFALLRLMPGWLEARS
jgi:hypothetical protein